MDRLEWKFPSLPVTPDEVSLTPSAHIPSVFSAWWLSHINEPQPIFFPWSRIKPLPHVQHLQVSQLHRPCRSLPGSGPR